MKIKKNLSLTQKTIDFATKYQNNNSCKSISAAIDEIVCQYEKREEDFTEELAKVILDKFDLKYKDYAKKIRLGINSSDFNTQVLIELINSMLVNMQISEIYLTNDVNSDSVIQAKNLVKNRIARLKQISDNKKYS